MGDIARPALAEVLAAITDRPVGHWRAEIASPAFVRVERISSRDVRWIVRVDPFRATTQTRRATLRSTEPAYEPRRVGNTLTRVEIAPAHTITPAEAVEALATARLWPWEPGDDPTRWLCAACSAHADPERWMGCEMCRPHGHTADPPSLAALVAVASLGAPSLLTAVELAGVLAPGAVVVWRVMTRKALRNHHGKHGVAREVSLPLVFSREMTPATSNDPRLVRAPWPVACPFSGMFGTPDDDRRGVHRAWPALRSLAALGVHLVALDASRVVLAVEAIGGDRG